MLASLHHQLICTTSSYHHTLFTECRLSIITQHHELNIYSTVKSLTSFSLRDTVLKGAELSSIIASSHTLKSITLRSCITNEYTICLFELSGLVEAALSSSTVEELHTDILSMAFCDKMSPSMKRIIIYLPWEFLTPKGARDCLCCIANLCSRMPALESLNIIFEPLRFYQRETSPHPIIRVHRNLYSGSLTKYVSHQLGILNYCVGLLSGFLRKDPKIARLRLKRSKSLNNLRLPHHLELPHNYYGLLTSRHVHPEFPASLPLRHAHSCPDLSGIHHMHPQLSCKVTTTNTGSAMEASIRIAKL